MIETVPMDDDEEAIDVDSEENLGESIPSKLYTKVETYYTQIRQAFVEKKVHGTFKAIQKRLRFGPNGPVDTIDNICFKLAKIASSDAAITQKDSIYRAVLIIPHPDKPNQVLRKQAPLRAVIDEEGNVELFDEHDVQERDNLEFYKEMLLLTQVQNEKLFERNITLLDKGIEQSNAMGAQAVNYAAGVSEIAGGLGQVTNAVVGTLHGAAAIVKPHQEETTAVQLAKLDQEGDAAKLKILMMMMQKFGGPLFKQITNVIGGGKKNAQPALEEAEAEVVKEEKVSTDDEEPMDERLSAWLEKLGDERIAKLQEVVGDDHVTAFVEADSADSAAAALATLKSEFDELVKEEDGDEKLGVKLKQLGELLGDNLTLEFVSLLPE